MQNHIHITIPMAFQLIFTLLCFLHGIAADQSIIPFIGEDGTRDEKPDPTPIAFVSTIALLIVLILGYLLGRLRGSSGKDVVVEDYTSKFQNDNETDIEESVRAPSSSSVVDRKQVIGRESQNDDDNSTTTSFLSSSGKKNEDIESNGKLDRFEVVAPTGEQLGLKILDSPSERDGVPVVYSISEHSALAGQVKIGDLILSVNDKDCTGMKATEVSELIGRESRQSSKRSLSLEFGGAGEEIVPQSV